MPLVEIDGTELFYEVDGDGPPCLVPHGGLGVDHQMYRRTLAPLAAANQLVFWDHRCNGRSGRPPLDTLTIEQLADDAAALATALGFERFNLIGHSYGGFVAQELALRHPDRLDRLVLVATTPGQLGAGEDPDAYAGEPPPPEFLAAVSVPPASDAEFATGFRDLLRFYLHRMDPAEATKYVDGTIFSGSAMLQGFVALAAWSSVDRLGDITAPTLLLAGRHDVFTGWRQMHRIGDRMKTADPVVVFEDAGHFLWWEEPEKFFGLVGDWLAAEK